MRDSSNSCSIPNPCLMESASCVPSKAQRIASATRGRTGAQTMRMSAQIVMFEKTEAGEIHITIC